jgi:hypothetical protein
MLVAQRVNDHVSSKSPHAMCDNCIQVELGLAQVAHATQITCALGTTSDFNRGQGVCLVCGRDRIVIRRA